MEKKFVVATCSSQRQLALKQVEVHRSQEGHKQSEALISCQKQRRQILSKASVAG